MPSTCDHSKWHLSHFQLSTVTGSTQDTIPLPFLYHWWSEFMQAFYSVDTLPLPKHFTIHLNQIQSPWGQHILSKYQNKCNALNDVKTHKTTTHIKKAQHHLKPQVYNFRTKEHIYFFTFYWIKSNVWISWWKVHFCALLTLVTIKTSSRLSLPESNHFLRVFPIAASFSYMKAVSICL